MIDRAVALKLTSARKGLANEHKRSMGKQVMMRKLSLLSERRGEEETLVAAAPEAGSILARLGEIYSELRKHAARTNALEALQGIYHGATLLAVGHALHEASVEAAKPDKERESSYRERNLPFLVKRLAKRLADMHPPHEVALLRRAKRIAVDSKIDVDTSVLDAIDEAAAALESGATLQSASLTASTLKAALAGEEASLANDPVVRVAAGVYATYIADRDLTKSLLSERDRLLASLSELQKANAPEGETFYPDANGCLRLSAGHVEAYTAADAVLHQPVTTLAGLIDKYEEHRFDSSQGDGDNEFACPERLVQLCRADAAVCATPVCICYSTDTVGGNSGSPVLDADGRFVAINFDRQRLGLMNEFKWSRDYSRSIGTDVRYILWLVGEYDGAKWLVEEMTQ